MVAIQADNMSPQRQRVVDLAEQAKKWKEEYDNAEDKSSAQEVYNRLCDTLDACNKWLLKYEGPEQSAGGVVTGRISVSWSKLP